MIDPPTVITLFLLLAWPAWLASKRPPRREPVRKGSRVHIPPAEINSAVLARVIKIGRGHE